MVAPTLPSLDQCHSSSRSRLQPVTSLVLTLFQTLTLLTPALRPSLMQTHALSPTLNYVPALTLTQTLTRTLILTPDATLTLHTPSRARAHAPRQAQT